MHDYKDIAIRAAKTFAQAFLGALAAGIILVDSLEGAQALLVASLAAGLSALQNWVVKTS